MSDLNRKSELLDVELAEAQLQRKLLNVIPALICIHNVQTGACVYTNNVVKNFIGYEKEEVQRGGLTFIASLIHDEDKSRIYQASQVALQQANSAGQAETSEPILITEYRVLHRNKTWRWLQTQATVYDNDEHGKVRLVMTISLDISERKLSEEWTKHALNDEINQRRVNEERLAAAKALAEDAQETSAANEEKYMAFIRNSGEGIWRFELEIPLPISWPIDKQINHLFKHGYLAEANQAMARMYGLEDTQDILGVRLSQLLIPSDPQNTRYLEQFITSGYRLSGSESHEKDARGVDKYFRNSLVGVIQDKHLLRAWGTQQDITPQYQASADLQQSEQRLALTIKASRLGIWEWDIASQELIWSNQLKKIYGLSKNATITYDSYTHQIHPDDRKHVENIITESLKTGRSFRVEHRIIWPDGSIHWVLGHGKGVFDNGRPVKMLGTCMNIDDRKEYEWSLRMQLGLHKSVAELGQIALTRISLDDLFEASIDQITERLGVEYGKIFEILPDRQSMILRAAKGWGKDIVVNRTVISVDRTSQSGYTAVTNRPVIVNDFSTETRVTRPEIFANHKVMSGITVIIQGTDGPYGVLGAHSADKREFKKDDINFLQSVANILGLAIQQRALAKRSKELEAINSAKDEFISVASHHLRTPASAVKMYLGLLREGYAGEIASDQREYIDQAYESNEQQLQVIEDILKVAEVDTMQVSLRTQREDIVVILQQVLDSLSDKLAVRKQHVHFKPTRKSYFIEQDVAKMRLVLENIIGNASKYSPEGKSICVKIRRSEGKAIIEVTDEGKGIDKADIDRIFDKFARIKNEAYISESGTGLGLYWAKKIVELHGGTITVRSRKGHGSTFSVHLPLADR